MTLSPSSLPATTQDYVGKSQFPPDPAVVPTRGTLHGSKGVFSYLVPANSLTVVKVAR